MADLRKISVIMGVLNCETTLADAVASIQHQTYENWEFIICNDGSTDRSLEILRTLAASDHRIQVISNTKNIGLNKTLNKCLALATGEYIARMDGDDISSPDRFEKQIAYLETHPETAFVSSWMSLFDEAGEWGTHRTPAVPTKREVVIGSPICHAPVMIRHEAIMAVGAYSESTKVLRVEDVDLWIRLYARGYRCYNIQETLYHMRNDKSALRRRKYQYRINSTLVRLRGCRVLCLDTLAYLQAFKPMVAGLLPGEMRNLIRRILEGRTS